MSMEGLVGGSYSVLSIFFSLHSPFSQLLHHINEMLAIIFQEIVRNCKNSI
jgi:hypothetical protein